MKPSGIFATVGDTRNVKSIAGIGALALAATGTNQATALQLSADLNQITSSVVGGGVRLPATEEGAEIWIRNDSGQTIAIYPFETSGTTINAGAASVSLPTAKTMVLKALSPTIWASLLSA